VQVIDANGQPRWLPPAVAARFQTPLAPAIPSSGPTPPAPQLVTSTRAAPSFDTAGGFTMGGNSIAPAAPVRSAVQQEVADQRRATAQVGEATAAPERPQPGGPNYDALAARYAQGDRAAGAEIAARAAAGDPAAQAMANQLQQLTAAGVLQPPRATGGGGPRVTQTQRTEMSGLGRELTPDEQAGMADAAAQNAEAERRQIEGLTTEYEAEARALRDGADRVQRAQVDLDAMRDDEERRRQMQQAQLAGRERELDGILRDVGTQRVDSDSLFANGNTRNRASAAIGLIFAGLADVFSGNGNATNQVMGIINGAIDRDVADQRTNIANASQNAQQRKGMLGEMRTRFGNEEAAAQATRAAMLEDTARQVRALAAQAQGTAKGAQLEQLLAALEAGKAQAAQSAILAGAGTSTLVREEQARSGGGGGRRPQINYGAVAAQPEGEIDRQEAQSLATVEAEAAGAIETVDRALEAMDNTIFTGRYLGNVPAVTDDAVRADQSIAQVGLAAARALFGQLTEGELATAQSTLGLSRNTPDDVLRENLMRARASIQRDLVMAQQGVNVATVRANRRREAGIRSEVVDRAGRDEDRNSTFQESPR